MKLINMPLWSYMILVQFIMMLIKCQLPFLTCFDGPNADDYFIYIFFNHAE